MKREHPPLGSGGGAAGRPSRPHHTAPAVDAQGLGGPIPQAPESELAVCGALLWYGDEAAAGVLAELDAECFYGADTGRVFRAAQAVAARGRAPSVVSIQEELQRIGEEPDGFLTWATRAQEALIGLAFLPDHIRAVREAAHRRQVRAALLEALGRVTTEDPGALAGEVAEKLAALRREAGPGREPVMVNVGDVAPEEVTWLWYPYLPRGKITLLEGDPGVGKSWLALALAAIVSRGWSFPGLDGIPPEGQAGEPADVLLLPEDGIADTVRNRLDSLGADARRVHVLAGWRGRSEEGQEVTGHVTLQDVAVLEEALARVRPALVVVDPIQQYLGEVDAWRAEQVRPVLARVGELAARFRCAVLLIRHLSKAGKDRAIYRGLGSIDFSAAARSV
ncbi:MAG: AAA family ATPase, partial [Bacillota bacterium]